MNNKEFNLIVGIIMGSALPSKEKQELIGFVRKIEKKVNSNSWIPCSERLPKNNKPVLCWVKSTTIASGETYIIGSCDNGFWFLQTYEIGTHSFPVKDYNVIAWQPLPEPYVEGGGKNDN